MNNYKAPRLIPGTSCASTYQCQLYLTPNVTCVSGVCQCPTSYYWVCIFFNFKLILILVFEVSS